MQEKTKLLPETLRSLLLSLGETRVACIEELRLREGAAPAVVEGGIERVPTSWKLHRVSQQELSWVLEAAGQGSMHTILDQVRAGFVSVEGGHRLGVCGSVSMQDGRFRNFRRISSLALRFCHEVPGVGQTILPQLLDAGRLQSTVIFSPPGVGKTTLLRDLIRCASDGIGMQALRVGVADERGEICGLFNGRAQRAVGQSTDILDGCPKARALLMLLRGMNPQLLAADEITAPEDVRAVEEVAGCGVTLLATAHGSAPRDCALRPIYRALLDSEIFARFVWITLKEGVRCYQVLGREEMKKLCGISSAKASS